MRASRRHGPLSTVLRFRARPVVVEHQISTPRWQGPELRVLALSDFHVASPYASLARLRHTVGLANQLAPDLIIIAGDFLADRALMGRWADAEDIVAALSPLTAPLGVFAVLGNHDWADCKLARKTGMTRNSIDEAMTGGPIRLLRNQAQELLHGGQRFWIVGFDSQRPKPRDWSRGMHDPDAAFAPVPTEDFTILAAHEPDYFALSDPRADVQVSGHTHAGQVNLFGWRPIVPSQFGARFAHGHVQDRDRHLIVSGGLGFSGLPIRVAAPPEITLVHIAPQAR